MHYRTSLQHYFNISAFLRNGSMQTVLLYRNKGRAKQRDPKGYRPISLLSCMGKIFEIVAKRITTAGVQCGAIANNQMDGRDQNSAIDALLETLDRIARDL
jgi:hypothetical protein